MKRKRYKINQKVEFEFAGGRLIGVIEKIESDTDWKHTDKYSIRDSLNYVYPIAFAKIIKIVK